MMNNKSKRNYRVISMRFKAVAAILIAALILTAIAVTISYKVYSSTMDEHYKTLASNLAKTAASQLDAEDLLRYYDAVKQIGEYDDEKYWTDEAYRADYDARSNALKDDRYYELLDILFDIKDSNGIEYLYVQKIDGNQTTYIMDADRSEDQCPLGMTTTVSSTAQVENPENGIPAFISTGNFGWLCTSGEPVFDEDGKPVAMVGVDISMNDIVEDRTDYLKTVMLFMGIAVVVIIAIILFGIEKILIKPINMLSAAARSFVQDRRDDLKEESAISKLSIRTGDEVETLCDSVKQMEKDINNYIAHLTAVTAEKERIGAELNVASQIQADMLPRIFPAFPERPEFDIYASMTPAKEVGGDFYDFFLIDDDHIGLVMADVSGKGVPAALFMVIAKTLIKNHAQLGEYSPSKVLMRANEQLCEGNDAELFVTVWLAIIEISTGKGLAANAGHEHPAIKRANGEFELIKYRHSPAVATMNGVRFKEHEFELYPGDSLFVYTDGIPEATNAAYELFGEDRLLAALNKNPSASPKELVKTIRDEIDVFVGDAPQFDDITMLDFYYAGVGSKNDKGNMQEMTLDAITDNLDKVLSFIDSNLEKNGCSPKTQMQIDVAVEELFVNIANYAYQPEKGSVTVQFETDDDSKCAVITLIDSGKPYDPLAKPDPDVTLSAEDRPIGGLGIYMVKKSMDSMEYEYRDGQNILTIKKQID